jgi:hypothetical protein
MFRNICAVFFLGVLLLGGCSSSGQPLNADSALDMLNGPIPSGKARVYVMAGQLYSENRAPTELPTSFMVAIDGVKVATVSPEEAVAIDVPAGMHILSGFPTTMFGDTKGSTIYDLGHVTEGQRIYVEMNRVDTTNYQPANGKTFQYGLLGFAADVVSDAINRDATHNSAIPHSKPGDYLDPTDQGPQLLKGRTLVAANSGVAEKLNRR